MGRVKNMLEEYHWDDLEKEMQEYFERKEREYYNERLTTLKDLDNDE